MQKPKFTRLFLVPTLAFSLTTGAVAPIVANAAQLDDSAAETTQTAPQQRVRLAKITSVNGTHYTAEVFGRHGRGGRGMLKPPTDDADTNADANSNTERPELPSDDGERPERPERKFDENSEDADGTNPFKNFLPDELDEKLPAEPNDGDAKNAETDRPQRGRFERKFDEEDGINDTDTDGEIDEDRPFRGGRGRFELDDNEMPAETIEFDAKGQDLAVDDIVALTFDGDTVTNVEKLDKDSMPEKPERGFRKGEKQEISENTTDTKTDAQA